jgi:hypothetical protein
MSAAEKTKAYAGAIKELKALLSGDIDGNSFEGMEQDVDQLSNKIKELKGEAREMTDAWRNMADGNLKGESGRVAIEALDNISEGAEKKANAAFAALGQKSIIQRTKEGIKNLLDTQSESYKNFSKHAASVVGSTMAIADGALSAERAVQTFGDESATAG